MRVIVHWLDGSESEFDKITGSTSHAEDRTMMFIGEVTRIVNMFAVRYVTIVGGDAH